MSDLDNNRITCDEETLNLMRLLAGRERRDIELYNDLIERYRVEFQNVELEGQQAGPISDGMVLRDMRDIEERNFATLNRIYRGYTNEDIVPIRQRYVPPTSYRTGLQTAFFNEIDDVDYYRRLYTDIADPGIRDLVYEMLTNELTKAQRVNFLFARNRF